MRLEPAFIVLTACCLASAACATKASRIPAGTVAAVPKPAAPAPAPEEPLSVPQTKVVLPDPQPIQAAALVIAPPPPTPEPPKPRVASPPKTEVKPSAAAAAPQGPAPPPANPAGSRRRIRPVESAAERRRLLKEIGDRQQRARDILGKARARQLSDAEKSTADRIQAFLEQTEAALKDQDLQQAQALSKRALLLGQELNPDK